MKRIYAIILAFVLLCGLAACSVPGEPGGSVTPNNPATSNGPAFVGSWEYSYTNNKNTVVSKDFVIRADNTATMVTTQTHADGTVEEKTVDYTWELNENGQVVIRSEKHTAVFNFNEEKDTLTNRNATAEKFTRVK